MPRLPNTPASEVEAMIQREWMICPGCGQDVQTIAAEGIPAQALRACVQCQHVFWMDLNSRPRLKPLKQKEKQTKTCPQCRGTGTSRYSDSHGQCGVCHGSLMVPVNFGLKQTP